MAHDTEKTHQYKHCPKCGQLVTVPEKWNECVTCPECGGVWVYGDLRGLPPKRGLKRLWWMVALSWPGALRLGCVVIALVVNIVVLWVFFSGGQLN